MTDEAPVLKLTIDMDVMSWMVPEAVAYRKAVNVTPLYAVDQVRAAFATALDEARAAFGELVDTEGWNPPDEWMPKALLDMEPEQLLGLFWIPARRENQALTFAEFSASVPYGALLDAFWSYVSSSVEEAADAAPLVEPNRAARRASGQRSKTGSPSRTSTAGRSKTSTDSALVSSQEPSDTETSA